MTRSSQIVMRYTGPNKLAYSVDFKTRATQRVASKRRPTMIARNVGELIEILKKLDPSARVLSIEPPFDGVKVMNQGGDSFLICRPRGNPTMNMPLTREPYDGPGYGIGDIISR